MTAFHLHFGGGRLGLGLLSPAVALVRLNMHDAIIRTDETGSLSSAYIGIASPTDGVDMIVLEVQQLLLDCFCLTLTY